MITGGVRRHRLVKMLLLALLLGPFIGFQSASAASTLSLSVLSPSVVITEDETTTFTPVRGVATPDVTANVTAGVFGASTITVDSVSGITVGMYVSGLNIPAGAGVREINGKIISLGTYDSFFANPAYTTGAVTGSAYFSSASSTAILPVTWTYSLDPTFPSSGFTFHPTTGTITPDGAQHYAPATDYQISAVATDAIGNPSSPVSQTFTLTVNKGVVSLVNDATFQAYTDALNANFLTAQTAVKSAQRLINALPGSKSASAREAQVQQTATQDLINAQATALVKIADDDIQNTLGQDPVSISSSQPDIDAAQALVSVLPNDPLTDGVLASDEQLKLNSDLQFRLDADQDAINAAASEAVFTAYGDRTEANIGPAQDIVTALPSTGSSAAIKTQLQGYLDTIQQPFDIAATAAVVRTETDVQSASSATSPAYFISANNHIVIAQALVDALPKGAKHTSLNSRISAVKALITATTEVLKTETDTASAQTANTPAGFITAQSDLDKAQPDVNHLPGSGLADPLGLTKADLSQRLNAQQTVIIAAANDFVVVAENLLISASTNAQFKVVQAKVLDPQLLVKALPTLPINSDYPYGPQDSLKRRLDLVQTAINNQASVEVATAVSSTLQADVNTASDLVNVLPDGLLKSGLLSQLSRIQTSSYGAATLAVFTAVTSNLQADYDSANALVILLPANSSTRQSLQTRLVAVKKIIDATNAVVLTEAETASQPINTWLSENLLLAQTHYETATSLVTQLPNSGTTGTIRENLAQRLTITKAVLDAASKVAQTETDTVNDLSQSGLVTVRSDYSAATNLVNSATVQANQNKVPLETRLSAINDIISATALVIRAETSTAQSDYNAAQINVSVLPTGIPAYSLLARLALLQAETDTVNDLSAAGLTTLVTDYNTAKDLVDLHLVPNSTTQLGLQARVVAVKKIIDATSAVLLSESETTATTLPDQLLLSQTHYNSATSLVAQLPSTGTWASVRQGLTSRLTVTKAVIDAAAKVALTESDTVNDLSQSGLVTVKSDFSAATDLVNNSLISTNPNKAPLQARLVILSNIISAATLAIHAETTTVDATLPTDIATALRKKSAAVLGLSIAHDYVNNNSMGGVASILQSRLAVDDNLVSALIKVTIAESATVDATLPGGVVDIQAYTDASTGVKSLPVGTPKNNLAGRLATVFAVNNATTKVLLSETRPDSIASAVTAQNLVAALSELPAESIGTSRANLQSRLDSVEAPFILEAMSAVGTAETATSQAVTQQNFIDAQSNVNRAQLLTELLPTSMPGLARAVLQARLTLLKIERGVIDAAAAPDFNLSNDLSGAVGGEIDPTPATVSSLPEGDVKNVLTTRLSDAQTNNAAVGKVVILESAEGGTPSLEVIQTAKIENIDPLPNGVTKDYLEARLAVLQAQADAKVAAPPSGSRFDLNILQSDINNAISSYISALPAGASRDTLTLRLTGTGSPQSVVNSVAITAVENIETGGGQPDSDTSDLVTSLQLTDVKKSLIARLAVLQVEQDIAKSTFGSSQSGSVAQAASISNARSDFVTAQAAVNLSPETGTSGVTRAMLQIRLDFVDAVIIATAAVVTAESVRTQGNYDAALAIVNARLSSAPKNALLARLATVKAAIDAQLIAQTYMPPQVTPPGPSSDTAAAAAEKAAAEKAAAEKAAAEKAAAEKAAAEKAALEKDAADKAAADKAAADKAAAEKAAAEKAAAEKAAADKAALEKDAADKATLEKDAADKAAADKAAADKAAAEKVAAAKKAAAKKAAAIKVAVKKAAAEKAAMELAAKKAAAKKAAAKKAAADKAKLPIPGVTAQPTASPTPSSTTKPKATPSATVASQTITCVKGKTVTKVSGTRPVCPSGFKKK